MCRWAAWLGQSIHMEEIISLPEHSLICQSRAATKCKTATNADGFGLAWYGDRATPGLYRDVLPAWGDANLRSIASAVRSPCFLAHVRASTGAAVSRNNCHPFVSDNWSFMHNGRISGFEKFRRRADMLIPDDLYAERRGATDSEALFLLALKHGLNRSVHEAVEKAVAELTKIALDSGENVLVRLAVAISDGQKIWAIRYSSDAKSPSLFYKFERGLGGWCICSEPLQTDFDGWNMLPGNSIATFSKTDFEVAPFTLSEAMRDSEAALMRSA